MSGIAILYVIGLWPIIVCPISGDDYRDPFIFALHNGDSWWTAWEYGFTELSPNHFSRLGMAACAVFHFVWLRFDAWSGLDHRAFYLLTRAVLYLLLAASVTQFVGRFGARSRDTSERIRKTEGTFAFVCVGIASTFQIHSLWSNDPVTGYLSTAIPATCLGLFALVRVDIAVATRRVRDLLIAMAAIVIAVFYYEMNVAVLLGVVVLVYNRRRPAQGVMSHLADPATLILIALPGALVMWARRMTASSAAAYGGTTWGDWADLGPTWGRAVAGLVPGAAWPLTLHYVAVVRFSVVGVLAGWLALMALGVLSARRFVSRVGGETSRRGLVALWSYAGFSAGLQAATAKYQDEISQVGRVYLYYTVGAVAVLVTVHAWIGAAGQNSKNRAVIVTALILGIGLCQQVVNSAIVVKAQRAHRVETRVLTAFRQGVPEAERCARWKAYVTKNTFVMEAFPMDDAIRVAYRSAFDADWCTSSAID